MGSVTYDPHSPGIGGQTKENSPTCARAMPAFTATRAATPVSKMTVIASMALTTRLIAVTPMIKKGWLNRNLTSKSIPIETKKKLVNTSRKGKIFPRACWLYSESEMMVPAIKAPMARESPILPVIHATERQRARITKRNNSRLLVRAI